MQSSDVGGKPETSHGVVNTDGTTAKEPVVRKKYGRNHSQGASGANQTRNHSQQACGEKEELKQQGYEDSEKNTEIWSDDEKNREEQSQQQAEEQSQRQAREEQSQQQAKQTKGRRPRQGEVRGETRYRRKLQPAVQMSQQGQGEVIMTIPKIDFNDEIVEYKKSHPDSSEAATQKVQKIVMDSLSLNKMYDESQSIARISMLSQLSS